ncbi:MAG: hypothetical protein HYW79_03945 [Parcubacteria group bacterium]|nr:hypothetical protein [Parcubacteria group bacterium]
MEDVNNQNIQSEDSFSKKEFDNFVKDALSQIKKINEAYKKLFESEDGKKSLIVEVETHLEDIIKLYSDLFVSNESGVSKISELNTKLDDIRKYHKDLLEGDESIKSDIRESQDNITDFYVYLFGGTEGEGEEKKIKTVIEDITKFHSDLTKDGGYAKAIESAHAEVIKSHEDLYAKDEQGDNKVSKLNKDIERIRTFRANVDNDISPFLKETKDDIVNKAKDVKALLVGASGGSLVEGFLKSKKEYKQEPEYKKLDGTLGQNVGSIFSNILMFVISIIMVLLDYVFFVLPLLISVSIFIQPEWFARAVGSQDPSSIIASHLSGLNFYGRLIISLPLWWISWFGQRSISHKRRLAEEYNHKAQVTKMYLNFSSRETQGSYPISPGARKELDVQLIKVIARHPGQVYGKDETMLDKIIQSVKAARGIKEGAIEDLSDK